MKPKAGPASKNGVPCVPSELPVHPTTGNPDWKAFFSVKGWRDRWFVANQQTARDIVKAMNLDDGGPPKIVIEAYPGAFPPLFLLFRIHLTKVSTARCWDGYMRVI